MKDKTAGLHDPLPPEPPTSALLMSKVWHTVVDVQASHLEAMVQKLKAEGATTVSVSSQDNGLYCVKARYQ